MGDVVSSVDNALTVLKVRPGDRVLIAFASEVREQAEADQIKSMLEERFPDVSWTVAGGVRAIVHQEAADHG